MDRSKPIAVWFEIPATDFDRAARFYETLLGVTLRREAMGPKTLGVFPYEAPASSGCILAGPGIAPADCGPTRSAPPASSDAIDPPPAPTV